MWTYPPHRILAAVDFGEASDGALQLAGQIAAKFGSAITAFHAETFEAPPYFTREQVRAIEHQRKAARRDAAQFLEKHATKLAGVRVEGRVSEQPAAAGILEAARDQDLIVMGTHGRRGPALWWAGSVAERVAREARSPVLVVREPHPEGERVFRKIVVVARGGTYDGAARRYAKGLAEAFGGEMSRETGTSVREATLDDATFVVLAQPGHGTTPLMARAAERVLRVCRKPLLFVPSI
jgi:nucleotide-binding universal stress UspA family protein